ncbi:AAA family ATPase [Algiphilus sp.]|uniref:AAA family ATPase n=1 Tax=Algiphilus sp. TaxID=1872431 RepID=UPI003B51BFFE
MVESEASTSASKSDVINIIINPNDGASYHSIGSLEWRNIPLLTVLTGENGAGKTQLLDFLAHKLKKLPDSSKPPMANMALDIEGDSFSPGDVAYIPNTWKVNGGGRAGLETVTEQRERLRQIIKSPRNHEEKEARARIEGILDRPITEYTTEEVIEAMPDRNWHLLDYTNVTKGLADIFFAYRFKKFELYERRVPEAEWEAQIGPPPWEVLNEVFRASGFPYEVTSPLHSDLESGYSLQLYDSQKDICIDPQRLSSGEQMILGVVMWLYNAKNYRKFPKLLLLDEPDAHLHPSMTQHFMSVLKDVLVDRYGVRVILTTHSPSTVAMSPASSIFVMSRDAPRISRPPSKSHSVGLLTSGLVTVGEATRYVLVEDQGDVEFYSAVKSILSEYGPRRDRCALAPAPSIVFLPASTGSGVEKTGGGSSVVRKWVDKFDAHPLDHIILGVVDHDGHVEEEGRIFVSDRYSIENYLFDPINVFGVLLDSHLTSDLPDIGVTVGNEHLIESKEQSVLQEIIEFFGDKIEANPTFNPDANKPHRSVEFTNGVTLQYRDWMICQRGHDLERHYQAAFGGVKVLSLPRLINAMRRIRLVPKDLAAMLQRIQDWRT